MNQNRIINRPEGKLISLMSKFPLVGVVYKPLTGGAFNT